MDTDDHLETIRDIIKSTHVAMLTTHSATGELHSRPLAVLDHDFDGTLWFLIQDPSTKVADVAADPQVNVAFSGKRGYLSISGTSSIEHDPVRIDELWNPMAEAWFEDGRDDPTIALLRVDGHAAEYWASDKPAIAKAYEFAKSIITDSQPDVGENRTVNLP